jgi:TetR/AcrR family transcriptional repressor of nem operon
MFEVQTDSPSTRDRLVMIAAELFMRHSFETVSVDDICKAADVKKGTLYHHFPSKTDLALAAYDFIWDYARSKLDPCFSPTLKPLERLERYAEETYAFFKEMHNREGKLCGCPLSTVGNEGELQDARLRNKIKEMFDRHCSYFESVLRDLPAYAGMSAEERHAAAYAMFSFTMGVKYQAKIMEDPEVLRAQLLPGLLRLLRTEEQD